MYNSLFFAYPSIIIQGTTQLWIVFEFCFDLFRWVIVLVQLAQGRLVILLWHLDLPVDAQLIGA